MPNRNVEGNYRYGYQGQEKDPETGMEAFELRLWDARIGRWLTTDPAGQYFSPYMAMGNNPISRIDPDGGEDNPIYGSDGTFRGVDEYGLQGEAIVYDGAFTNGMSQSDILSNGGMFLNNWTNSSGFSQNSFDKIVGHHALLPTRPDWDGKLTFSEANNWARNGNGESLYLDIGQIDLSKLSVYGTFAEYDSSTRSYFSLNRLTADNYNWRSSTYINFLHPGKLQHWTPTVGLVLGTIKVNLLSRHTGEVNIGGSNGRIDLYDFEQQKGRHVRNALTWYGDRLATAGGRFNIITYEIYGYGRAFINKGF